MRVPVIVTSALLLAGCGDATPPDTKPKNAIRRQLPPEPEVSGDSAPRGPAKKKLARKTALSEIREILDQQSPGEDRAHALLKAMAGIQDADELVDFIEMMDGELVQEEAGLLTEYMIKHARAWLDSATLRGLVDRLKNKLIFQSLVALLGEKMRAERFPPADALRWAVEKDPLMARIFFSSFIKLPSPANGGARNEVLNAVAGAIGQAQTPAKKDLAVHLGVLATYGKDPSEALLIGERLKSAQAAFRGFVDGYMETMLKSDSLKASEWLLSQDGQWRRTGALAVADYLAREGLYDDAAKWVAIAGPNPDQGTAVRAAVAMGKMRPFSSGN